MKQILKTFHEWYNEGIINSDAATRPEDANYKACSIAQAGPVRQSLPGSAARR